MKLILIVVSMFVSFFLRAQNEPARISDLEPGDILYRDSVHYFYFTSSGEKYLKYKDYFEHNDFGYFLNGNKVIYDSMESSYLNYYRWENTFNENHDVTHQVNYNWDKASVQWMKNDSIYQEFDDAGNRIISKTFKWESNKWKGINYYFYQYNDAKEAIQYSRYVWINNEWALVYQDGFNDDRNRTVLLNFNYDSEGLLSSSYEWYLEYNPDGKLLNEESISIRENYYYKRLSNYYYEGSKKLKIDVYHGNSSDDLSLLQVSNFTYKANIQYEEIYVLESKSELIATSFDEMGNETHRLSQQWNGNEWRNYHKTEWNYDGNQNVVFYLEEFWNSDINDWASNSKSEYEFDAYGNRILAEHTYWNSDLNLWEGNHKTVDKYDIDGNLLLGERYLDWNQDSQDWIGDDKYEYQYIADEDGFRDSLIIDYNWDYISDDWIKNYEKLSYFSTTSDRILGVDEIPQLVIYPNPAMSYFKINSISEINSIQIFDESGRLILEDDKNEIYQIDNLTDGNYIVRMKAKSGETFIRRLIKN